VRVPIRGIRRTAIGVVAAAVFAVAYVLAAPSARGWAAEHLVAPILTAAAGDDAGLTVSAAADPPSVVVSARAAQLASYSIPLGVLFFLPALLLIVVAPDRPYWALFAGYLVLIGLIDLGVVAAGLAWSRAWLTAHLFIDSYVIRPTSIAVPLLFLEHHRRTRAVAETPA
jgi:hypothetical protein